MVKKGRHKNHFGDNFKTSSRYLSIYISQGTTPYIIKYNLYQGCLKRFPWVKFGPPRLFDSARKMMLRFVRRI